MKNFDDSGWARTKSLLRKHLTAAPLKHPDLVNRRVLQEIERLNKDREPAMFPLRWLAWFGACSLLIAGMLALVVLPRQADRRSDGEVISEVVTARAEMPQLSVSEFRAPDQRGVVIWLEGVDYIPADASVR